MGQLAVAASASVSAAIAIAATVFGQKQKANPMNVQNFSISIWKGQHREAKKMCACIGRLWAWLGTMRERVCSCQRQQTTLIEFKVSKCRVLCAMQRQSYFFLPRQSSTNNTRHMYTLYTHTHSGANCTIGTVVRTERARKAQKNSVRTRNSM